MGEKTTIKSYLWELENQKTIIYNFFIIFSHLNEEMKGGRTTLHAKTAIMNSPSAHSLFSR